MPGKKAPPLKLSIVDRMALVVRAKQPFLDWIVQYADPEDRSTIPTLADLRTTPDVFLIPESETPEAAWAFVRKMADVFFAQELEGWYQDPDYWPAKLDYKTLKQWFDLELIDMVLDLSRYAIRQEFTEEIE